MGIPPVSRPRAHGAASEARKHGRSTGLESVAACLPGCGGARTGRPGSSQSLNRGGEAGARYGGDMAPTGAGPVATEPEGESAMTAAVHAHAHAHASSADVRARLNHPIVDCDGHMLEHVPVFLDFPEGDGGPGDGPSTTSSARARARTDAGTRSPPRNAGSIAPRAASVLGGFRRGIPSTGPHPCCPDCCASGSTSWGSTSPSSTRPSVLPLRRARGGRSTCLLPRPERDGVRALPRARGPDDACRVDPDVHPGRGHRGAGVRGQPTRPEGRDDREPRAPPAGDGEGRRSDAARLRLLDRQPLARLAVRLRPVLGEVRRAGHRAHRAHRSCRATARAVR